MKRAQAHRTAQHLGSGSGSAWTRPHHLRCHLYYPSLSPFRLAPTKPRITCSAHKSLLPAAQKRSVQQLPEAHACIPIALPLHSLGLSTACPAHTLSAPLLSGKFTQQKTCHDSAGRIMEHASITHASMLLGMEPATYGWVHVHVLWGGNVTERRGSCAGASILFHKGPMGSSTPQHTRRVTQTSCSLQGLGTIPRRSLRGAIGGLGAQYEWCRCALPLTLHLCN